MNTTSALCPGLCDNQQVDGEVRLQVKHNWPCIFCPGEMGEGAHGAGISRPSQVSDSL